MSFRDGPEGRRTGRCDGVVVPQTGTSPTLDDSAVLAARDAYRSSLARSLEAARRHDQFRQRLHAIDSAHALVCLVFGLEGQPVPDVDGLPNALAGIEAAQDWPAGYLRWALLNLVVDPAPKRQLELARRVDRLLTIRGIGASVDADAHAPAAAGWQVTTAGTSHAP